ncbi:AMP-binding enzyme [Streptomyces sp. NPDC005435]|uniref:AMP-binding enzyme n=1 Tax=Streptomyces sp. NPDC005435 TaxID=3154464 RepID=UPI0034533E6F
MLICKGYNVCPQHLEEIRCAHPAVAQASVVGVPAERVGEIPVAYVVPRPGAAVDEDALRAHVAERGVPYARLRGLRVVGELPVSPAGKILENRLRDRWTTR